MYMKGGKNMYTVKQARQLAGLSQDQIAKMMGVCTDTYRRIEKHPEKTTIEYACLLYTSRCV